MATTHPPWVGTFSDRAISVLRSRRDAAMRLPPHGEPFAIAEVGIEQGDILAFKQQGIVSQHDYERVRTGNPDSYSTNRRTLWMTSRRVHDWIQANMGDLTECPGEDCHATGIVNLGDGFTCSNDRCDARFGRETAKELIE